MDDFKTQAQSFRIQCKRYLCFESWLQSILSGMDSSNLLNRLNVFVLFFGPETIFFLLIDWATFFNLLSNLSYLLSTCSYLILFIRFERIARWLFWIKNWCNDGFDRYESSFTGKLHTKTYWNSWRIKSNFFFLADNLLKIIKTWPMSCNRQSRSI